MKRTARPKSAKTGQAPEPKSGTESNPFWDFSVAAYGRDGTAPACLALQDLKGLDVNLLLFCCWAGVYGRELQSSEIEGLISAVKPWRTEVVEPLRKLRRQLRSGDAGRSASEALIAQAKSAELEAEAVVQRVLFETLPLESGEASAIAAAKNLKAYAGLLEVQCDSAVTADLAAVLRGAFPLLAPLEAVWTLS